MQLVATLALNPAVDMTTSVADIVADRKLRCSGPRRDPGGGGINVARVVDLLGGHALAIWTRGGLSGAVLADLLAREFVEHREIPIHDDVRENVTVMEDLTGRQYRFVLPGPTLSPSECRSVAECIETLNPAPHYLVLSGSLPNGAPSRFYADLARNAATATRVVVDTSGDALIAMRGVGVFLLARIAPT